MSELTEQMAVADRDRVSHGNQLEAVKEFWNNHVHDWKVARSPAGTKEFFEEIEEYRYEKLHYLPQLVDFAGYAGKRVLDVGCGVGNDLSRFARGSADVVGIDLAEHSVKLATDNFKFRGLEGKFFEMDGEAMSFPDNSFDLVFCHTVLHFTPRPEEMIREILRITKSGGEAIIMTVNRRSWLMVLRKLMNIEIDHLDAPVFYDFTRREFRDMLSAFSEVRIVPERFPVKTKVHSGWKAFAYNSLFVGLYNSLPKAFIKNSGHHLMAFVRK